MSDGRVISALGLRGRVRLLAPLLAILLLAAPALAAPAAYTPPTAGDRWEMRADSTASDGARVQQSLSSIVAAVERVTVEGIEHDAARQVSLQNSTSTNGGFGVTTSTRTESWARVSDGAALRSVSTSRTSANFAGFPAGETTTETTYLQPCRHLHMPFDVGDAWTSTCRARVVVTSDVPGQSSSSERNETSTVRVLRSERVTTAAGTFDTLVLEWTQGEGNATTTFLQWYAPTACSAVRTVSDVNGVEVTSELLSYRCARSPEPGAATASSPASPTVDAEAGEEAATPGAPLALALGTVAAAALALRRKVR